MQTKNIPFEEQASPVHVSSPDGPPEGAEVNSVAFIAGAGGAQAALMEFKEPRACRAILVTGSAAGPAADLVLLLVPASDHEDPDLVSAAWGWVEPSVPQDGRRGILITLHGARIIWRPGRAALIAPPWRLSALRRAIIDFSFYDGEIRSIEDELARAWPDVEGDTRLVFQFDRMATPGRDRLARRFQQAMALRARLARINPMIHHPPVYPPTLASQLGERLRERTQVSERVELLGNQLEVFKEVYEACGSRFNEFASGQRDARLQWTIIVLIAAETVAMLVQLMASNWT